VFVNDTDVRHLEALDTPVAERDSIVLLPAMAGGCETVSWAVLALAERSSP